MKKYLIRSSIFVGLSLLFFLPAFVLLIVTKEAFVNVDKYIKSDEPYLIGYGMNEENYKYLKWQSIIKRPKNEVMALGSSRVLQFRKEMFTSPFYNAGFTIQKMKDFLPFIKEIPKEKRPKILIIGLDQWMFNPNTNKVPSHYISKPHWESKFIYFPTMNNISKAWRYITEERNMLFLRHKGPLKRVGINASVYNTGFRNDGSKYYGYQIYHLLNEDYEVYDFQFEETIKKIKAGDQNFEYSTELDFDAYNQLYTFLTFCKENKIHVIGILPPFAEKVNKEMCDYNYAYISKIFPRIQPMFDQLGFESYDFTSMAKHQSNDLEMLDGYHGGEKQYLRLLLIMLKEKSILNQHCNIPQLENDLENAVNDLKVYLN
ncbi:hypothetical protein KMW28_13885 [Flammeovirga yaeyamensis]|uniref:Uncharacterized protein n=1 Tax=Flammeovirga yaeyamensis TaxID=367791 RepID=A0AAX1N034_9BACT|nr:D-alanyl-lipoteichoic acid biosynthesis protein DltD [Flammeovirga yaeyamensis]MBB3700325.1 hypothetical protein [Flammeovirga yaeyamensis]NMF37049.1 D-alanyl-lipoteichoic acid biosynthesis protein DltD [Flammeovirga yaeyamensis]QWG00741.1 hypothetical protein KMW28_13885 [Flammeovirga yaeyamensis]